MNSRYSHLKAKLALLALLLGAQTAHASFGLNVGLNYNNGGAYGYGYAPPMFGYGYGGAGFGSVVNACGMAANYPGYAYMPATPAVPMMPQVPIMPMPAPMPMPMPAPMYPGMGLPGAGLNMANNVMGPVALPLRPPVASLPPHLAMPQMGWGPNFASYPAPGYAVQSTCVPCNAGMQNVVMVPVPGGPAIPGACGAMYGTCPLANGAGAYNSMFASSGIGLAGNGTTIIDMRSRNEWEKNDTGEIVWATALGLGMQASNVTPMAVPRYGPTFFNPMWWGYGDRPADFIPRPHGP